MDKLLLFGDANLLSTKILLRETLRIMQQRKDVRLAGVVDTARSEPRSRGKRIFQSLAVSIAKKLFNSSERISTRGLATENLYDICRNADIEIFVPRERDVNSQDFLTFLTSTIRPTLGLSIGCLQIFRKPLIDVFEVFVNYHNGLLPKYRGLHATAWSLYFSEEETGYTYHHINEAIDDGTILMQDTVRISEGMRLSEHEYRKTMKARKDLGSVMEMMIRRDSGSPQEGVPRYFGRKDFEAITTINDPSQVSYEEIQKRLRIFGALRLKVSGNYYGITRFKSISSEKSGSTNDFITQDNVVIRPVRMSWLPVRLYKTYLFILRLFSCQSDF